MSAAPVDRLSNDFRRQLLEGGLLAETGTDGVYGRGAIFEDLVSAVDSIVGDAGHQAHPHKQRWRFPPVTPKASFEKTDYPVSFPDLMGAVDGFTGDKRAHAELLNARASGQRWEDRLTPTGLMLVPAACHQVYPLYAGQCIGNQSLLVDVLGICFRHEPSTDPFRMQSFRLREFVLIGSPDDALEHRASWVDRAADVLGLLGLAPDATAASDPFFGTAGSMLARKQLTQNLKTELVITIDRRQVAVASTNYHQSHFGQTFDIRIGEHNDTAHSACVGFGLERLALCVIYLHGPDPHKWPTAICDAMPQ